METTSAPNDDELTAVFMVNSSETYCSACDEPTLVDGVTHHADISGWSAKPGEGCGARFVGIQSQNGAVADDSLRRMRPDLPIVPRPTNRATPTT